MWIESLLHIEFHMFCAGISSIYIIHAFLRQYYLKKKTKKKHKIHFYCYADDIQLCLLMKTEDTNQ